MKTYYGRIISDDLPEMLVQVTEGGQVSRLKMTNTARAHSPTGFAWGYEGSGPAALAHSLLADVTGVRDMATCFYREYMKEVIAKLDNAKNWTLSQQDVESWILNQMRKA